MINAKCLPAVLLTFFLAAAPSFAADETVASDLPTERFNIRLSAFFATNIDTTLRVDSHLHANAGEWNTGTTIDLAKQLNVDTSVDVFRGEATWTMTPRQRLDFAWFDLQERGQATLGEVLNFGDSTFASGAIVNSYMRTNIFRLSYTYFVIQRPGMQLGLSLGAHVMDITTSVGLADHSKEDAAGLTAPLPVVGANFTYALTPKVLLRAHGEYLAVSYEAYSGELVDLYGAVEWRMSPQWSLGGGYEYFAVDVLHSNDRYRIDLRHDWIGYQAYLSFRF